MPISVNELEYGLEPMPTLETWKEYLENEVGGSAALRYVDSTVHMLQKIEAIVNKQSFEEMKQELVSLYHERRDFVEHAINNRL